MMVPGILKHVVGRSVLQALRGAQFHTPLEGPALRLRETATPVGYHREPDLYAGDVDEFQPNIE